MRTASGRPYMGCALILSGCGFAVVLACGEHVNAPAVVADRRGRRSLQVGANFKNGVLYPCRGRPPDVPNGAVIFGWLQKQTVEDACPYGISVILKQGAKKASPLRRGFF